MGLMDSLKHRFSTNMKITQLMYMTQPTDIVRFCQSLSREDRGDVVKGIESAFKWQPVAQIAQAFFPAQASSGAVVDAVDLAQGGYVSGAVDLMRAQSQNVQAQYGMTAMQQAALEVGLDVVSGLHTRLGSFARLRAAAERHRLQLIDVRHPTREFPVATGRRRSGKRLLTVGTDCALGKKYTALALTRALAALGVPATFRATGLEAATPRAMSVYPLKSKKICHANATVASASRVAPKAAGLS